MRAIYDRQGPANDVLVQGELPTPEPGTGAVRVRLEASGVNPSDTYRRRGAVPAEYPRVIPNSDGAGIDRQGRPDGPRALGRQASMALQLGQRNGRLDGHRRGIYFTERRSGYQLPSHVSFAEGATLGIPGNDRACCVFAARSASGQSRAGNRGRRRGRALCRATRRMGRCFGDRDSQLGRKSREGASRRRSVRHQLPHGGCRGACPRHHRRRVGRPCGRCRSRRQSGRDAGLRPGRRQHRVLRVERSSRTASAAAHGDGEEPDHPRLRAADQPACRPQACANRHGPFHRHSWRILSVDGMFPLYETAAAHLSVEQGGKIGTVVVEPQK